LEALYRGAGRFAVSLRIGIIGASGFVGSTLCERLYFSGHRNFIPFVRSTGNAWRVARLPVLLRTLDLQDPRQVRDAVSACDVIVNCALPDNDLKARGLQNLANACRKAKLQRFVHLSSIAIYGRDPGPDSVTEAGEPDPAGNPYGILKLRQDRVVLDLQRSGVPSYLLWDPIRSSCRRSPCVWRRGSCHSSTVGVMPATLCMSTI
jgi:nucleoside-diphosphate-sugar epimerase